MKSETTWVDPRLAAAAALIQLIGLLMSHGLGLLDVQAWWLAWLRLP